MGKIFGQFTENARVTNKDMKRCSSVILENQNQNEMTA